MENNAAYILKYVIKENTVLKRIRQLVQLFLDIAFAGGVIEEDIAEQHIQKEEFEECGIYILQWHPKEHQQAEAPCTGNANETPVFQPAQTIM